MYIIKGKVVFTTEGQTYEAEAGQAFLIKTQKPHIYGAIGALEALWIHFNGKDFHPFFEHLWPVNHNSPVFNLKNNTDFYPKQEDLVHSFATSKQYPEIIVSAKLYEILDTGDAGTESQFKRIAILCRIQKEKPGIHHINIS